MTPRPTAPLRLAIITDSDTLEAWQVAALRRLPRDLAGVVLLVDVSPEVALPRDAVTWAWGLYRRHRLAAPGRALHSTSARGELGDVPAVTAVLDREGDTASLPVSAVDRITHAKCQAVVNFTGRTIRGLPRAAAAFGMWEFRVSLDNGQAEERPFRSATAPTLMQVSLVRLAEHRGVDEVLRRGWVHSVPRSLAASTDASRFVMVDWLTATCRELRLTGVLPGGTPARTPYPMDGPAMARVAAGSPVRTLRWAVRQLIWQEEWHVGIVDKPIDAVFREQDVGGPRWLSNPSRRHYLADPFGVTGGDSFLVEDFDYITRRGFIAAVDLAGGRDRPKARAVMRSEGHMSYPYLFRWHDDVYCVPETSDQHRATLYRATRYPDSWEAIAVVASGLAATDPTVVRHDDHWWMFCTDDELGPGSNLHIYHAPTVSGPWRAHILNPVKVDIRSARPAGTPFVVDGTLIRPAQDNAKGYGSGIVFNAVERLTPHEFSERVVGRLVPDQRTPYRHGLHTVSAWGERTLIDGKRKGPSITNLIGRLRKVALRGAAR